MVVSGDKQHGVCGKKKWNWVRVLSLSFHFLLPTIIPSMFHIHIRAHPSTISVTYSKNRSRSISRTKHTPRHTFVFGKFSAQLSLSVLRVLPMGIQKSLHFKEKIKAINSKKAKSILVHSYDLRTGDDNDDNPPKRCNPWAKNNNLHVTTILFI